VIVLVLPARDEAPRVGNVIRRAPDDVTVLVVDDGSTDGTADVAVAAGAKVVDGGGRGLGAAVRTGFAEAVSLGADVVVFCDADGEYDPAELPLLVAPILRGEADYVVGSRFAGEIHHMHPHRRAGNRVLTRALALLARAPITDGQSGYRALSRRAATEAEIIHDYNYAQVLTLDLLRKGFRYGEVPITYSFRESGDSFVKLLPYLRRVVPAVGRELRRA
jgi:glycosyltransferase involved in cell wall biosynthesis